MLKRLALVTALACVAPGALAAQDVPDTPDYSYIAAPMTAAAKDAVAGINRFTLDLFKRVAKPGENAFLSPASVSTAMALAYRGARGETADELRRVLYYSAPPEAYLAAQTPLLRAMTFVGQGRQLSTNNSLWVQDGLAMNPAYLADTGANAEAGLQRVDYMADPDRARGVINAWVSTKTHDRIKELLHIGVVTRETRAVLINTIYWKATWASEFNKGATKTEPFHLLDGKTAPAPLMHQLTNYRAIARDGVRAIDLPYRNGEVAMTVLMPDKASGLNAFEAGLNEERLARWLKDLDTARPRQVDLALPKMHMNWDGNLVDTFKAMGVQTAFDDRADFTGVATVPAGQVLAIGAIIHQTWLDVDETGSEAAAATAVVDIVTSGRRIGGEPPPPPFVFRADKPFLFLLRDNRTGAILFIGRYTGPDKAS